MLLDAKNYEKAKEKEFDPVSHKDGDDNQKDNKFLKKVQRDVFNDDQIDLEERLNRRKHY